ILERFVVAATEGTIAMCAADLHIFGKGTQRSDIRLRLVVYRLGWCGGSLGRWRSCWRGGNNAGAVVWWNRYGNGWDSCRRRCLDVRRRIVSGRWYLEKQALKS